MMAHTLYSKHFRHYTIGMKGLSIMNLPGLAKLRQDLPRVGFQVLSKQRIVTEG
jgi:hypothetical protein